MSGLVSNLSVQVSVIVPMYNVENLISETIESLKLNSQHNIEFLIIDDGSTDDSYNVAQQAINGDERFIVVQQKNQGVSSARNYGLDIAKGEYITFVDSDDTLTPYALDKMYNAAIINKADFVYGEIKRKSLTREWYIDAHLKHNLFSEGEKTLVNNSELIFFIGVAGKLIHKSLVDNIRFPLGMKFSEDTVVIYQAFLNSKKIFTIPDLVYFYRERDLESSEASATQQKDGKAYLYLADSLKTMSICRDETLLKNGLSYNEKIQILKKYYDRFFSYEVWPLFLKVLREDKPNISNALSILYSFLLEHDSKLINKIPAIRFFFIKVLADIIYFLRIQDFIKIRKIFIFIFNNLNDDISRYCAKKTVYGTKWAECYRIAYSKKYIAFFYYMVLRLKKIAFFKIKHDPKFIREILFPILKTLPVNKGKVIFATNRKKPMSSNFEEVYRNLKDRDNLTVYKFLSNSNSAKTIFSRYYHLATAEVVFLEDYYKPIYGLNFNKKTKVVQLWHACGAFKKFSFSALDTIDSNTLELELMAHSGYTHVITSSKDLNHLYSEAFNIELKNVASCGVPRTDIYFDERRLSIISNKVNKKYPEFSNTINILYAPTFRGGSAVRSTFNLNIDWGLVSESLPNNYRLIIKLHPVVKEVYPPIPSYIKDKVTLLPSTVNIDEMMVYSDILITDYSSLIFEYSLLNKPIIYFPYDIGDYFDERGFYFEYSDYLYGDVVYNTENLIYSIKNAFVKQSLYIEKREKFKKLFMSGCDGKSTKRLIDLVF